MKKVGKSSINKLLCMSMVISLFIVAGSIFGVTAYATQNTYFLENFEDGNLTANPVWTSLLGTAAVFDDSGNKTMKDSVNYTRYSAPVQLAIPSKQNITISYRVRCTNTPASNAGGVYLVNDSGAGYGFVSDLSDAGGRLQVQLHKNTSFGDPSSNVTPTPWANSLMGAPGASWYTVAVKFDTDKGKFDVYVNGKKVGTQFTDTTYNTFTKVVAYGKFKDLLLLDDIQIIDTPTTYLEDDFLDGNLTYKPTWSSLSGTANVTNDGGNNVMGFSTSATRYSSPVYGTVSTSERITVNYRIRKPTTANAAGIYLVNDSGAGYGIISDLNDSANCITVKLHKNTSNGDPSFDTNVWAASLSGAPGTTWHDIAVIWDTGLGKFEVYVDGTKIGTTLTDTTYNTFTKTVAYAKFANSIYLDNIKVDKTPEVLLVNCSWFTPIGSLNGRTMWLDYKYLNRKSSTLDKNYPLDPTGVTLPDTLTVGSEDYYTYQYQAILNSELPKIKAAGFDVMLYDMLSDPDSWDPLMPLTATNSPLVQYRTFKKWIEAAEAVGGIKIGLMAEGAGTTGDYPNGRLMYDADWIRCLKGALDNLPSSNAVWKIDGKPVLTMFGSSGFLTNEGTAPTYGWQNVITTLRNTNAFYWMPDINPTLVNKYAMGSLADAGYCFAPAGPAPWMTQSTSGFQFNMKSTFETQTTNPRIPFYLISSPGYYTSAFAYTQPDFNRIHDVYLNAINAKAKAVNVISWNDLNEDHDIMPSGNKGAALTDIYTYYNTWFKTGVQPSASTENITISYPRHLPGTISTAATNWGGTDVSPPFMLPTGGLRSFYWANLKTSKTLQINSLTSVVLPAGLSYGEIDGLTAGTVTAKINGVTVTPALPDIKAIAAEPTNGGLQYYYKRIQ